jgi:hypothetical protein
MDIRMTNEVGFFGNHREFGCIIGSAVVAAHCEYRQGVPY